MMKGRERETGGMVGDWRGGLPPRPVVDSGYSSKGQEGGEGEGKEGIWASRHFCRGQSINP